MRVVMGARRNNNPQMTLLHDGTSTHGLQEGTVPVRSIKDYLPWPSTNPRLPTIAATTTATSDFVDIKKSERFGFSLFFPLRIGTFGLGVRCRSSCLAVAGPPHHHPVISTTSQIPERQSATWNIEKLRALSVEGPLYI